MALTIMIIRHGEKPPKKDGDVNYGQGITEQGAPDEHSLAVRGWQRAGAWTRLFVSGGSDYPKPDIVYAADPDTATADPDSVSKRPLETIQPLCRRLKISPNTKFGVGDEEALVNEVLALNKIVLISWEHKKIGEDILPLLTPVQAPAKVPKKWDRARFDVVLRFDRDDPAAPWNFQQLFPQVLAGDLATPMP